MHLVTVREALSRLLTRPSGAFVIIEEPRSGKFVQFAGSKDEPLLLDLPSQTLSPDEMAKSVAPLTRRTFGNRSRRVSVAVSSAVVSHDEPQRSHGTQSG